MSKLPFITGSDSSQRSDATSVPAATQPAGSRPLLPPLASAPSHPQAQISVPLSRTSVAATASFEVRSPKRLQVQFERGIIQTPELLADIEVRLRVCACVRWGCGVRGA